MTLNYKYTILYTFVSLLLLWIVINYGSNIISNIITNTMSNKCIVEGLTDFERYSEKVIPYPKDAVINYNDTNSPAYSHSVNLPIKYSFLLTYVSYLTS